MGTQGYEYWIPPATIYQFDLKPHLIIGLKTWGWRGTTNDRLYDFAFLIGRKEEDGLPASGSENTARHLRDKTIAVKAINHDDLETAEAVD